MLTAFQVETGAYITEDGDLLCQRCFDEGDVFAKPVSNYGLDEWQTSQSEDYDWNLEDRPDPEGVDFNELHAECEPALFDVQGHELREAYHFGCDDA